MDSAGHYLAMEGSHHELLRDHGAFVRRIARALLRDEHQVDDVVQQTWVAAWRRPPAPGNVRAWLARVARRCALKVRRAEGRRGRHEAVVSAAPAPVAPPEMLARLEVQRAVVDAVMALPEPARTTVVRHYFEGLDTDAIARADGITATAVRTRLRRARRQLRGRLERRHRCWALALLPLCAPARAAGSRWACVAAAAAVLLVGGVMWAGRVDARPRAPNAAPREAILPQGETTMKRRRSLLPAAAVLALAATVDAKPAAEGTWQLTMTREGWTPRVVTGTVHVRKDGGWLSFNELSGWTAMPLKDVAIKGRRITATVDHPVWPGKLALALKKGALRGTYDWSGRMYPVTATRAKSAVRFEKGLAGKGFLKRGKLDSAALDALIAAAEASDTDALIVLQDGKVVCERTFGRPAGPVYLMSITKVFAGLCVMALIEDGKIPSLDTPLSHWFPDWKTGKKAKVTLRHVLRHESGLQHNRMAHELNGAPDRVAFARASDVVAEPGAEWQYNNRAMALLSGVIAAAAGRQVDDDLKERLFTPLGFGAWDWFRDRAGNACTYADLKMTARDLAKVGQLLLQDGVWEGRRLLPAGIVAKMTEPGEFLRRRMGLVWWLRWDDRATPVKQTAASLQAFANAGFPFAAKLAPLTGKRFPTGRAWEEAAFARLKPTDQEAGQLLWRLRLNLAPYVSEGKPIGLGHSGDQGQHFLIYPKHNVVVVRLRRPRNLPRDQQRRAGMGTINDLAEAMLR